MDICYCAHKAVGFNLFIHALHSMSLVMSWVSNRITQKTTDVIIYPCHNLIRYLFVKYPQLCVFSFEHTLPSCSSFLCQHLWYYDFRKLTWDTYCFSSCGKIKWRHTDYSVELKAVFNRCIYGTSGLNRLINRWDWGCFHESVFHRFYSIDNYLLFRDHITFAKGY